MEIRLLKPDEIALAEVVDGVTFPEGTLIIGALSDGRLVGRIALMRLWHLEGTWVDEAYRGGTLAARLVTQAERALVMMGCTAANAYTPDDHPEVGNYLSRFGYARLPVTPWTKLLNEGGD